MVKLTGASALFLAQTVFSLLGTVFAIGMLATGHDAGIYLPILTGILGFWMPSPSGSFKDTAKSLQQPPSAGSAPNYTGSTEVPPLAQPRPAQLLNNDAFAPTPIPTSPYEVAIAIDR